MKPIRDLLSQNPMTFNELLDLFEAYVATIGGPLLNARNLIGKRLEYAQRGDIFVHVVGVADDAYQMAARLKQIRTARNAGTDVQVTLSLFDARIAEWALQETTCLLSDTESALGLLQDRLTDTEDNQALSLLALSKRALQAAEEREFSTLRKLGNTLTKAMTYPAEDASMEVDRVAAQLTAGGSEQQPRTVASRQE